MKGYVMTIRKNFNFDDETAHAIEKIAKEEGITQTQTVKKAIELLSREQKRKKRLEALNKLAGCVPPGSLVDVDIRQVRIEKALKHAD